jgi:hypothetical protein
MKQPLRVSSIAVILSLVAILFAGVSAEGATITVDDTGAPPTTDVIFQLLTQDQATDIRRTNDTTGRRDYVQTFTVTSPFSLDAVSVLVAQDPDRGFGQPLRFEIFSTTDFNTPFGTNLAGFPETGVHPTYTKNVDNGPSFDTGGDVNDVQNRRWLRIDIADVTLTNGVYGFRIGFDTAASANFIGNGNIDLGGIFFDTSNPISDGRAFRIDSNGTANVGFGPLRDLSYVFQGTPVPEPSSICLGIIGLLGLNIVGRNRRS